MLDRFETAVTVIEKGDERIYRGVNTLYGIPVQVEDAIEEHVRSEEFDCSKKTCNNDLISRRAVLSLQRQVHEHTGLFSETFYPGIPAWEVMQLPEVTEPYKELPVRCAACEWYDQKNYVCNHEQGMRQPSDSGFCSCGERRINDGEI